jgi:structure-specific recognition protein 1
MGESLEYDNVFKEDKGSLHPGRFKANTQGIVFKNSKTGKLDQIAGNEITAACWQRLAAAPGLRLSTKSGGFYRFGGFGDNDMDKFVAFFREHYAVNLREREFCLKGWNWGHANFNGSVLNFDIDKTTAFEVPLTNVSHCTSAKNEVTCEFHTDEGAVSLMELRFHIPNPQDGGDDPVQSFVDKVMAKADIIQATGDAIVTFSELHCLTPRGRYDIKLFPTFIQLHGKTFDYKIPLTTVLRLFRLPQKDGRQVFFVMSLDPPIKQGQTRYHFLILNFNKDDVTRLELNVQDDSRAKFADLGRELEGPTIDLIGKVMKALVQRKITLPSDTFCGKHQLPVITCSYKSNSGVLYPLDRGFIFVHKPPIHVRNEEIAAINFARGGSSTRSFDFEVETKTGTVHVFSSIEKEEYGRLFDFVQSKKLKIKNTGAPSKDTIDDDDDMVDSDDEDEPDAYLHRVKQEGRERDDSDEESDASFDPNAGSGGSDVAEEFDSNASESESDDSDASAGSSKKKKKEKPEKKAKKSKPQKEKKKSSKKDSDPNKPKKPMTAYFLWAQENRDRVKEKYPDLKITDVAKKLGEMWKEVSDKSKWEKEASRLAEAYKKDMADYKASGPSTSGQSVKSGSKSADSKKKKAKESSPQKSSFKSREFVDDSSDSDSDSDKKKKKQKKAESSGDDEDGSDGGSD